MRNQRRKQALTYYSILIDKQVTLQGSGLKSLRLPDGFQTIPLPDGTPRWRGKYPAQGGIPLERLP